MSLSPNEKYPGATEADPNYKDGKFKDNNPSTTNNGSPLKAIDRNEQLALQEAVMDAAGFEYNGTVDTPENSQMFAAYKAALSNGANLLSNHNFLIPSPDDSQPAPSATPTSYPPGYQIFSGVFANETSGITNLTYVDGHVSFSGGDFYMPVASTGGLERLTDFIASVADFDGKPRTRGVSFALVGNEYRVTVGVDALEDTSGNPTPLGSVKFEQGAVATKHEVGSLSSKNLSDIAALSFDSLDLALNSSNLRQGVRVSLKERVPNSGGGGSWSVKLTSSVSPNGFDVVQCILDPSLSLVFSYDGVTFLEQLADNPENWSPAIQYAASTGRQINLSERGYPFSDTLTEEDTVNIRGVQTYNLGGPNEFIPSITNTSRLIWTGADDVVCIDMDMKNCSRNSITNVIIQVPNSYSNKVAILRGGSWQSVGGVNAVYWDNIGWYRETPIDSPTSTSQPLEIDCQGSEVDGRAAFNWFIRGYCFNFSLTFSALVDNNGSGSNNFINSNTFEFRTYQCYREVNLVAGTTSGNIITHNNFKWVSQPAKNGGVSFDGRFFGLNLVSENRFDALEWDVSGGRQFNIPYSNSRYNALGDVIQLSLGTTYTGLGNFEEVIHKHQDASFSHRVRSKDADTLEITSNTLAGAKDNAAKEFISVEHHVEDTANGLQNTYINENVGSGTIRHSGDGAYSFGKTTAATTVNGLEINTNPLDADSGRANFAMAAATNAAQFFNAASGGLVGSITVNAGSTSYNTTSDARLKEFKDNPTDDEVLDKFNKIYQSYGVFTWKDQQDLGEVWGFNAQKCVELGLDMGTSGKGPSDADIGSIYGSEVVPPQYSEGGELVREGYERDKIVTPYSVDQSKAVPVLVAIIEQLLRRVDNLEGSE